VTAAVLLFGLARPTTRRDNHCGRVMAPSLKQDKARAKICENCPVCNQARRKQRGLAYALVKKVEGAVCPFGRSYTRVRNRKPHEPVPTV
jgi:hypothetical protein